MKESFKISPEAGTGLVPSQLIPKACFTTDDTSEFTTPFYTAPDGTVAVGLWEGAPCKMEIESYPVNEKMTIISGELVLTHHNGVEEVFGPGEVVFVTKGAAFTWHVTKYMRKYFMTAA